MLTFLLVVVVLLVSAVSGESGRKDNIRVYRSHAIIRKPFNGSEVFSVEDWNTVDLSHLHLDNCPSGYTLRIAEKETDSQKVVIRIGDSEKNATIVCLSSGLVREESSGRFLFVDRKSMEFWSKPFDKIVRVSVESASCPEPVLSYTQKTIRWWSQHRLSITQNDTDSSRLTTWANVQNNGKSAISTEKLELIADSYATSNPRMALRFASDHEVMELRSSSPIHEEHHGLHVYPGISAYIGPQETLRLPLFVCQTMVRRKAEANQWLTGTGRVSGEFRRGYLLKCDDHYIPEGSLVIEEESRVVGEVHFSNTGAGIERKVMLGNDAELQYKRVASILTNTLSSNYSQSAKLVNTTNLLIDLELKNVKSENGVDVEYMENLYADTRIEKFEILNTNQTEDAVVEAKDGLVLSVRCHLGASSILNVKLSVWIHGALHK